MIRYLTLVLPAVLLAGCFSQPPAPAVDRTGATQSRATVAAQPSGPGYYTVKRGDTLYRIALENGQDYRDVAAWNNIANPATIKEGQILRVSPPNVGGQSAEGPVVAQPISSGAVETRSLDPAPSGTANAWVKREPKVGKEPYSDEAYARLNKTDDAPVKAAETKAEVKPEPSAPSAPATPSGPDEVPWQWPVSGKLLAPFNESSNKGLDISGKSGDPVLAASDGKVVYAGSGLRGYGELVIVKHNATYLSAYAHNRKILVKEGQSVTKGQKIAEMGNTDADTVKLHFEIRKQGKPVDPAQYLPKR